MQKMVSPADFKLASRMLEGRASTPQIESAQRTRAIGLMCVAIGIFSLLDTTSKYLIGVAKVPLFEIVWLRFASQLAAMIVVMGLVSVPRLLRTKKPGIQLLRSCFLMGSTLFNFMALRYLRLDQTVTISFMMPLLVALLAGPVLGEWVGWRRMLAIMTGFLGILVVVRPGFGDVHFAVGFSLLCTLCYSLYNLATRYLAAYDASDVTLFWGLIAAMVVMAPLAYGQWIWPESWLVWGLVGLMGVAGGLGHYLLIVAHRHAPASVLAPFSYMGIVSMIGAGYLVFGDLPDRWTLTGGAIIIGSGLYLFYRERVVTGKVSPVVG